MRSHASFVIFDSGCLRSLSFSPPLFLFYSLCLYVSVCMSLQQVPWIVVTGHRPMYCADTGEYDQHMVGAKFQTCIEPLFQVFIFTVAQSVRLFTCAY